jgi:uncharacterized phage protein (TIGR01671 family)
MNRQIKFRGKRIDNGEWIYGLLTNTNPYEINNIQVQGCSVGQFTGATDKNGKEIYEGDIIKAKIEGANFITEVKWGLRSRGWKLKCDRTKIERWNTVKYYSIPESSSIEVIGNIHDNTELLTTKNEIL